MRKKLREREGVTSNIKFVGIGIIFLKRRGKGGKRRVSQSFFYKEGNSEVEYLDKLTAKYNLQVRDAVNKIKRGALTRPKRYDIFQNLKKKYRNKTLRSAALAHGVTSL